MHYRPVIPSIESHACYVSPRFVVDPTPSGVWREGGVHPSHHSDVELLFEVDAR